MKLKPSLDVESIEDFKKYYEGAYLKGRDGTIWKVREVATRSKQVVMQIGHEGAFDELTIFDWDKVGRTLRFGRYFPGMFVSGNNLNYVSDSAERSVTRGLNFREVGISGLAHGVNANPGPRDGPQAAWDALNQDYLINPTDVWSKLRAGQCVVLNRFTGVAPHALPEAAIFVREQYIGCVHVDNRTLYMDYPHWWTTYGRILTKAFNGDLRYLAPGSRDETPELFVPDALQDNSAEIDRRSREAIRNLRLDHPDMERDEDGPTPRTGNVDWNFLRHASLPGPTPTPDIAVNNEWRMPVRATPPEDRVPADRTHTYTPTGTYRRR